MPTITAGGRAPARGLLAGLAGRLAAVAVPGPARDAVALGFAAGVLSVAVLSLGLMEVVLDWMHRHERHGISELMPLGVLLALGSCVFAGRRNAELQREMARREASEARMRHMALHDGLTGLPNRALLAERLVRALARVRRDGGAVAVLCLDLDRFKEVNDTLGHPVGDELLRQVAGRLAACVRETDTVARLGGDEFAVVQVGVGQPEGAGALARRLVEALAEPFDLASQGIVAGASVGVTLLRAGGDAAGHEAAADAALKEADLALYRAKAEGRGTCRFFEPEMDARLRARRRLEQDLRHALAESRLELHYQPQLAVASGEPVGFEALMRWPHPGRGMVPPAEFIPLAEETGLILPLGERALRQACAEAAGWPAPLRVSVNLSPVQFRHPDLAGLVAGALGSAGLDPGRLELEITEGVLLQDTAATLATLRRLRALGVRISMDDFGTGYSSLSYLRSFPFDKIKIDRSFVADLGRGPGNAAIVRAVIALGRSLGMTATAEGVEDERQLDHLRAEGCDEAQGFHLGRPMPAAAVLPWLAALPPAAEAPPPPARATIPA